MAAAFCRDTKSKEKLEQYQQSVIFLIGIPILILLVGTCLAAVEITKK